MASRTRVAHYLASRLADSGDRAKAVQAAAAWLVTTGRSRQDRYLARDVAQALSERGYVLVRIATARPLDADARAAIESFLRRETGAQTLELEEIIDPALIGGVRLELPGAELDATVRRRLTALVEGAQR